MVKLTLYFLLKTIIYPKAGVLKPKVYIRRKGYKMKIKSICRRVEEEGRILQKIVNETNH